MKKAHIIKITVIIGTVLVALSLLMDSMIFYALKTEKERKALLNSNPGMYNSIINLGLDIQGGSRLVLEIATTGYSRREHENILDKYYMVIENRVNRLGVSETSIQKLGINRLVVEVPGLKDPSRVKGIITPHGQLEFKLLEEPKMYKRAIRVIDSVLQGDTPPWSAEKGNTNRK